MVTCPNCGAEIKIRRIGEGTSIDPATPLSANEQILLQVLQAHVEPLSVRQIERILFERGIRRHGRQWNYHLIQADLSRLVGRGLVEMIRSKNIFLYRARC